jgi:hypothetical protein
MRAAAGAGIGAEVGKFAAENAERLVGGSPWYYAAASAVFGSAAAAAAARKWRRKKREKGTDDAH